MISAKKFEATLKPKLDRAVEEWHDTQPPDFPRLILDEVNLRIRAPWSVDTDPDKTDGQS